MKVLIVDDSKPILMMVTQMLEEIGHQAVTAVDGADAYNVIATTEKIELILLDWNMPNMNGLDFLKKNYSEKIFDIPIFMMTTEKTPDKIKTALENGAVDYIMKPFTPDILENKIEMLIELAG